MDLAHANINATIQISLQGAYTAANCNDIVHEYSNPIALRMVKTPKSFGRSECKRVTGNVTIQTTLVLANWTQTVLNLVYV